MRKTFLSALCLLLVLGALPALAGWDEGVAAFKSKNFSSAVAEFQELIRQNPEGWRGHYMLGLSLEQLKRKEEALNHLRKAYDLNPNDLNIKVALGRAYYNVRRYRDVTKLLSSIDPSSLPAAQQVAVYSMLGKARSESGDSGGALRDFAKLAKLKPNDAKVQYTYGTMALASGQLDTGIAALDKASKLAPSDVDKKRAYAQALIKKGRTTRDKAAKKNTYIKAASVAQQLVSAASNYDNLMLKVSAELGAGLYTNAVDTAKAAIAKKDTDWLAHYYLGQAYSSAKQFAEAESPLFAARDKATKDSDKKLAWTQLGFIYEKQKKYTQSIEAYDKAGNQAAVARVTENKNTETFNKQVEEENKLIQQMEAEAKALEDELKALEGGGSGN